MGAATRSKKQDNRKANEQPNHMQATLAAIIGWISGGVAKSGQVQVPQNGKLSPQDNVTFNGGIRKGWFIDGAPVDVLNGITITVEGVELKMASSGVHESSSHNDTVCFTGIVELPSAKSDEPVRYMAQVWVTYRRKDGDYVLSAKANPFALPKGTPGPAVVGEVSGDFDLELAGAVA